MNNKGLTLVELLAVIVVLSLILTIVVPNIFNTIDDTKLDVYKAKEEQLKKAASDYVLYNNISLPEGFGLYIDISLIDLVNGKFVSQIKDLDDDSVCDGYVRITKTNSNNYTYDPFINCTNYSTPFTAPPSNPS